MDARRALLIVGNVIDGLRFIGPFQDAELANEYADRFHKDDEWVVGKVERPIGQKEKS